MEPDHSRRLPEMARMAVVGEQHHAGDGRAPPLLLKEQECIGTNIHVSVTF